MRKTHLRFIRIRANPERTEKEAFHTPRRLKPRTARTLGVPDMTSRKAVARFLRNKRKGGRLRITKIRKNVWWYSNPTVEGIYIFLPRWSPGK